jgi:hypothetical protein
VLALSLAQFHFTVRLRRTCPHLPHDILATLIDVRPAPIQPQRFRACFSAARAFLEVTMSDHLPKELDEYAAAIGEVCIALAYLESLLDFSLTDWLGIKDENKQNILTGHTDLTQKVMMLKGLGFLNKPSDDWFERFKAELNNVINLLERRNRVVHDIWSPNADATMTRIRMRVAFARPQSFKAIELSTIERVRTPVTEIWKLVEDMNACNGRIIGITNEVGVGHRAPHAT